MIKLIVGLGNFGEEYSTTRHNVGKIVVEAFPENSDVIILKNDRYMNESGESVVRALRQYNISVEELCVVHDDFAFEVGDYRLQKGKNANGHNCVENIIQRLGTKDFWRLRVGIGSVPLGVDQSEYVLSKLPSGSIKIIVSKALWMWEDLKKVEG